MTEVTAPPAEEVGLDLDEGRPSTFRLRGEVFSIRHVAPRTYAKALRSLDEREKGAESSLETIWEAQLDFIAHALVPKSENGHAGLDRFDELRQLDYDGIEVRDIRPTMRFIMEVLTGRPTQSPEDSSSGPGSSAHSSKAAPTSPGVVRPS
jgi:hypothetical protein